MGITSEDCTEISLIVDFGVLDLSCSTVMGDTANSRGLGLEISKLGVVGRNAGVLGRPTAIRDAWYESYVVLTLISVVGVVRLGSEVGVALFISGVAF